MKKVVKLDGVKFYAFHGVFEEEKKSGNNFIVDIAVTSSIAQSLTDNLNDTVDYSILNNILHEEMAKPSQLMEHVIHRIIDRVEKENFFMDKVFVRMKKLNPAFGGNCDASVVEVEKKYPILESESNSGWNKISFK